MKGNIFFITAALFVISVIITLNLFFQQNYQAEVVEQFNRQQLLLAQTISQNVEGRISHLRDEAEMLSGLLGGRMGSPDIGGLVATAVRDIKDEFKDLRVFDKAGKPVYSTSEAPLREADSSLIERVRREGGIIFSEEIETKTLKLASPVKDASGSVKGVLLLDLDIDSLNRRFVEPIKSGSKGYAWMMDSTGTLLFHPTQPAMEGKNLFKADASCFNCHKSFETERKILESGAAGVQSYIAPFGEDKIVAFSKVHISPESFWIAVVSMPYSEVTASMRKSMRLHSILILAIFGATAAAASTIVVINRKRIKAEESARHEAELERYAGELEKAVNVKTMELRSEKEKLDAIVGTLNVGLFLVGGDRDVVWANKTLLGWFGREKAKGLTLGDIYGGAEAQSAAMENASAQDVFYNTMGERKGYFQVSSIPLAGPDGRAQVLGVVHDVTEIKRFEESMGHSEKLASLGRLTAGIAHEIGNPLTSVFSFLQILREMETEDFKKESLDTVLFHINRIADIVRQLSGLAKLPPAESRATSVNELVESSLSLLQYDKRAKGIKVVKDLGELPDVVTDRNQLSQVFVNIILNAADAMPEGGSLTVRSRASGGDISVAFEDTGTGISEEDLQKVFDPFFTTKDKGTGLGLSVSYSIMKRLGGDISAESEKGKGTRFRITIPLKKDEGGHGQTA